MGRGDDGSSAAAVPVPLRTDFTGPSPSALRHMTVDSTQSGLGEPAGRLSEYRFLVGHHIDRETLLHAAATADEWGVDPHEVLLARKWITPDAYVAALARHLGVALISEDDPGHGARTAVLLDGTAASPSRVAEHAWRVRRAGHAVALVSARKLLVLEPPGRRASRARHAVTGLLRRRPALSAATPTWRWQLVAMASAVGLLIGCVAVAPEAAYSGLFLLLTLAFLPVTALRVAILSLGLTQRRTGEAAAPVPDIELPVYSILVPLYGESEVLPDLVAAIAALDYPAAKLDVLLVLESIDAGTRKAAEALDLPSFVRVVIVPDSLPRTKPKALNYALQIARGDFVVVYDAEDVPEPDQLRRALAAFHAGREETICVQSRLNIHNAREGWLARQFALEYSVLFDLTLPGLARLGLPIPLGGTSNHFPRRVLDRWTGWDPFNVTEDADLGIRLARSGGRIAMIDSTTWEEAPIHFGVWLRQRTRWLKGWMQTYLVHTRQPALLLRELGLPAFIGFHVYSGGAILSALAFPLVCAITAIELARGDWLMPPEGSAGRVLWIAAAFNLGAAYLASVVAGMLAVCRRGWPGLAFQAPLMPVYWVLISIAAYRAMLQLVAAPYLWEKTAHRSRRRPLR